METVQVVSDSKIQWTTSKDFNIHFIYGKNDIYNKNYTTYRDRKNRNVNRKWMVITLAKNKKIDPEVLNDICEKMHYPTEHPSPYRSNIRSEFQNGFKKCKHNRTINYIPEFMGIILDIQGSRNGYYDYSLDHLPTDLPITYLHITAEYFKHSINKLPDNIKYIYITEILHHNIIINYLPEKLEQLECSNNHICNLPSEHPIKICLFINNGSGDIDNLPNYIKVLIIQTKNIIITNLPINLKYLYIYEDTVLLDIPYNLIRLNIKFYYKDSNVNKDIIERLVADGRENILKFW